jgi:hypothetical protein
MFSRICAMSYYICIYKWNSEYSCSLPLGIPSYRILAAAGQESAMCRRSRAVRLRFSVFL